MGIEDRGAKKTASANIVFLFCISAQKLPSLSRSCSLRSDHIAIVIIEMTSTVEQPPAYVSPPPAQSAPSVEVADRDGGVVQLRHDGRLPLQVLGDAGVDLVKCPELCFFRLTSRSTLQRVVGIELKNHLLIIATII